MRPVPVWKQTPLERAESIATEFEYSQRIMWSSMWPIGHCAVSSLLLNPLLTAALPDLGTAVVVGVADDCRIHAWIETYYGDVIDPTWGQFDRVCNGDYGMDGLDVKKALRVEPAHNAHEWAGEICLTPAQEDFYRRSINPTQLHSGGDDDKLAGWNAGSKVKKLFGDLYVREVPVNV